MADGCCAEFEERSLFGAESGERFYPFGYLAPPVAVTIVTLICPKKVPLDGKNVGGNTCGCKIMNIAVATALSLLPASTVTAFNVVTPMCDIVIG